jgi:hypothetical protein
MRLWFCVLVMFLGCGPAEEGEPAAPPSAGPIDVRPCDRPALWAQCPLGSVPSAVASGCVPGAIGNDDGSVGAVCVEDAGCIFTCVFQDPCPCGVDRITREVIECSDCRDAAACGDARCNGGENPDTCPIDCAETCLAGAERCNGPDRQVCAVNGRWDTLPCRADQVCEFDPRDRDGTTVICQTRISPSGGVFHGFGASPGPLGDSAAIEFRAFDLCEGCRGVDFLPDGRILVERMGQLIRWDPEGGEEPTGVRLVDDAVAASTVVARGGRWPELTDLATGRSAGVDAIVHDGAEVELGGIGLSANGSWFVGGFAVGVPGFSLEPIVAVWNTADRSLAHLFRYVDSALGRNARPTEAVAISRDGRALVEGRDDGLVIVWDVPAGRSVWLLGSDVGQLRALAIEGNGNDRLLLGGWQGIELWQLSPADGDEPRLLWRNRDINSTRSVDLSPDGQVAAIGDGRAVHLLDETGRIIRSFRNQPGRARFDATGSRLLVDGAVYEEDMQ